MNDTFIATIYHSAQDDVSLFFKLSHFIKDKKINFVNVSL